MAAASCDISHHTCTGEAVGAAGAVAGAGAGGAGAGAVAGMAATEGMGEEDAVLDQFGLQARDNAPLQGVAVATVGDGVSIPVVEDIEATAVEAVVVVVVDNIEAVAVVAVAAAAAGHVSL